MKAKTIIQQLVCPLSVFLLISLPSAAAALQSEAPEVQRRERSANPNRGADRYAPTKADVAYGDHQRHVLDFWQAESDKPTPLFIWIHGGGFRGGDKKSFPAELRSKCLEAGISCASIHYRLSSHAPYPAQMLDSARAVQFLRSKAGQWNLDPERFAAGGGSAGSGISQWLGYHDDLADADSDDPIAKQSTRLACVFPVNMQSTYDPREIKKIIPGKAYNHPALLPFFARPQGWDWDTDKIDDELDALLKDASPVTHLTPDDAPIFLLQYARAATTGNIHHPNFGEHMKKAADAVGVECVAKLDTDYQSMSDAYDDMVKFMNKHFAVGK
ncbi:MAG: alpha/beta hydrolase [Planctomycetales bacterium]|nr:alpha/beta hydrolase [Planctomycetales bacterium]